MLIVTVILVLIQFALALASPPGFVYFCLWTLTIPYWWNFDAQLVYQTPLGPLNLIAMQLFGFLAACVFAILPKVDRALSELSSYRWHLLFLLFYTVAIVYAPSPAYGFRTVAKLIGPPLFMVVVLTSIRTEEQIQKVQSAILGSGVIILGLALFARAMGISTAGLGTIGPPGMGPAVFCAHMLPVTMLAMASTLCRPKLVYALFTAGCAVAILAALQRTSAGGLFLGLSVVAYFGTKGPLRFALPASGVVALPALLLFSESFRNRMFFEKTSSKDILADPSKAFEGFDGSGRFELWDHVLRQFFYPNPALGSGAGATQNLLYSNNAGQGVVHSEYVRMLCEVGLIGLALFVVTALVYLFRLARQVRAAADPKTRLPPLAALGALVTYLVYFSTDNGIDYVSQLGIYVFALIAIAQLSSTAPAETTATAPDARLVVDRPFRNLLR